MHLRQASTPESPSGPKRSWHTRLPFFYGWVIVGSAFFSLAVTHAVYYSFSVFYVALLEEYDWSRASAAGIYSLFVLIQSLVGPLSGGLVDRFGASRVMPVGGLLLAASLIGTSRITELWQFYLLYGVVCGLGLALAGWVPTVAAVSGWFSAKRGMALGITSGGIGLGIVVTVPFCQYLISTVGWRNAYVVLAGMVLLLMVPQVALVQVARPEQLGLKPDGVADPNLSPRKPDRKPARKLVVVDPEWASCPWSLTLAVRTSRFWLALGVFTFSIVATQMLMVHQVAYLVDGGFDKMLVATLVGLVGLVSIPIKVFWGAAADRWGRENALTYGLATVVLAILVLAGIRMISVSWLVFVYALIFAAGYAVTAPVVPVFAADIFAGRNFGSIFGALAVGNGIGGAVAAWLAGYIFDVTGSYLAAFAVGAACCAVAVLCVWLAAPRKVRRMVKDPTG